MIYIKAPNKEQQPYARWCMILLKKLPLHLFRVIHNTLHLYCWA